jgi:Major Facilitator Superfamily
MPTADRPLGAAAATQEGSPFRDREFRALWLGRLISNIGDQFARVALSLIAFHETGSAGLTAATYALTFLPSVLGGPLLGGLVDRYPRRSVVICCDVGRGTLIAVAAIPGMPFAALIPLVFAVSLLEPPSDAARSALLATVISGARYVAALSIVQASAQLATLVGFAAGGVLVAAAGTHTTLVLDTVSFAVSALITWLGVRHRAASWRATPGETTPQRTALASLTGTIRFIATHGTLSRLAAFTLTVCCLLAPEALAAPYAARLGAGATGTGLFLAAFPLGFTLGGLVMTRVRAPARLLGMIAPAFVLAGIPLICFAARPGLTVAIVLWAASGLLSAPLIAVNAAFVRTVPDDRRGAVGAVMGSVVSGGQGLVMIAAGGAAELLGLADAIAAFGVIVVVGTVLTSVGWHSARTVALTALGEPTADTDGA